MIDTLRNLVPEPLLDISGVVPYTGRVGFTEPAAPLYFLALNPGGAPVEEAETLRESMQNKWGEDAEPVWSSYLDESWSGRPPGTHPMQRRMRHLFDKLGLDLRRIPASNVMFPRSVRQSTFLYDEARITDMCWPFHQAVIDKLGIRTVIVGHADGGPWVCQKLGATKHLDTWRETNNRRWSFHAHETPHGLRVLTITHPSVAAWTAPATDPTEFIKTFGKLN